MCTQINELILIETIKNPSNFIANYAGLMGAIRLERRGKELWNKLSQTPCSSIRKVSSNNADQKAYYRFLNNENVTETNLIIEATRRMENMSEGSHLLCIQDTSEVNLVNHKGRIQHGSGFGSFGQFRQRSLF